MRPARLLPSLICLLGLSVLNGCAWLASPLGPSSIPAIAPAAAPAPAPPVCGFTDLGHVLCTSTFSPITIIRNAADWALFAGDSTCSTASTAPPVDLSVSMIVIFSGSTHSGGAFTSACEYPDRVEVALTVSTNVSVRSPSVAGPCLCYNTAIAIPQSSLPIQLTECDDISNYRGLISHTCTTTVY